MRLVRMTRFGGPEVLEPGEAPDPEPGAGEMAVDVALAEVLFLDTQLRAGWGREYFELPLPFVLGEGVTGVVAAVGDGVDDRWVGRTVIAGMSRAGEYNGGGYAERAVVAADAALEVKADAARRGVGVVGIDEQISPSEQRRSAEAALARLAAGELRPVIGRVVPLEGAADAHAAIENRTVAGKTLVVTGKTAV